jgi:hypothetical protein
MASTSIEIPWTEIVAMGRELEAVAARYGIKTALTHPTPQGDIVALPVIPDKRQLDLFDTRDPSPLPQLDD